ncbi:MAG: anaerobic sulfatase maturase [Candidatus Bathyarchaeia archaeon]
MQHIFQEFQIFVKPIGPICNLSCRYCYYLEKEQIYPKGEVFRMAENVLESYIIQHIEACPRDVVNFSWHGGEPTMLGVDYFRNILRLQRKHGAGKRMILNGVQTNGTLLDEEWCRFFAEEGFYVGLSLDGPEEIHDRYRLTRDGRPTYREAIRGYSLLRKHGVETELLCVVNEYNVRFPLNVYHFFKEIGAKYITFLPLVQRQPDTDSGVSDMSVPSEAWGQFLCSIFDEWVEEDIGRVKVQVFEEALRTALGEEHSVCIFRPTCGDVPVLEHNGDLYVCDHFVDAEHLLGNLKNMPLRRLLEDQRLREFGENKLRTLPRYCRVCEVKEMCNGECPKNRFLRTPEGELGLNYLCAGYRRFFTHCRPFVSEVAALWRQK